MVSSTIILARQAAAMKDFFASYTSADQQWAEWIAWQLEATGYSVVIQAWDFRPGSNFVLEMQRAASEAERTIAVLSPKFLASLFTQPEWAAAIAQDPTGEKRTLVPVRVRECELQGLLSTIVYIDLVGLDENAAKQKLLVGIQSGRAKPTSPPPFPIAPQQPPPFPGAMPLKRYLKQDISSRLGGLAADLAMIPATRVTTQPGISSDPFQNQQQAMI